MRIKLGGREIPTTVIEGQPDRAMIDRFERQLRKNIMAGIRAEVIEVSPRRLRNLAADLENAALVEALKIFEVVVAQMDGRQPGFSGSDIAGTRSFPTPGQVYWRPLSPEYAMWKGRWAARNGRRPGGFFVLRGNLRRYFQRYGRSIVLSRFGGITVDVDVNRMQRTSITVWREGDRNVETEMGRITLKMFPNISPSLLPMLASGSWTDHPGHSIFEATMLPDRTADKLSGGSRGAYRPLVLPIVQFFMLSRIPGVVSREVKRGVRRRLSAQS